ncbi:hypothetical protein [Aliiglaciecola aliphaticivorans]
MNASNVFTTDGRVLLTRAVQKSKLASWKVPLQVIGLVACTLAAIGAMSFEWEIMSRIFSYLAGAESEYWSPWIMGFSSLIIVLGLHFLAMKHPDHQALATLERIAGGLMLIFLIGIGLLLAAMLYQDGLGDILGEEISLPPLGDDIPTSSLGAMVWLDALMRNIGNPLATLAFSLGIGSLTLMSVFVTHNALNFGQQCFTNLFVRINMRKEDIQDLQTFLSAQHDYETMQQALLLCYRRDNETLLHDIADEALTAHHEGLAPTARALSDARLMARDIPFADKPNLDIKEMEKRLNALNATSYDDLIKLIK